jgi:hypothetical protein
MGPSPLTANRAIVPGSPQRACLPPVPPLREWPRESERFPFSLPALARNLLSSMPPLTPYASSETICHAAAWNPGLEIP